MEKNRQSAQLSQQRKRSKTNADEAAKRILLRKLKAADESLHLLNQQLVEMSNRVNKRELQVRNAEASALRAQQAHMITIDALRGRPKKDVVVLPSFH